MQEALCHPQILLLGPIFWSRYSLEKKGAYDFWRRYIVLGSDQVCWQLDLGLPEMQHDPLMQMR